MLWIMLIAADVFEAVWAMALGNSEAFTKLVQSIILDVDSW